nr:site-specific integrase [Paenibacillus sp. PL91]
MRFAHRIIKDILDRAVEWRILKSNPVAATKRPKVARLTVDVYDEVEVSELLNGLSNEAEHWRIMITMAITTGLRRGELLALEWKHINIDEGFIEVLQSLNYVNGQNIIKPPKTKNSIRKVSVPKALLPDLIQY